MPKLDVVDRSGAKIKSINMADAVFGIQPHKQAMFDAIVMQRASERQGTHDTKTRSEVRGGGRKPYRQKGTGRARQGSIRAVQWRGGGISFGPTPRSYEYRINRKVRRLAIRSALSQKMLDKAVVVVDKLDMETPSTKDFLQIMENLKLGNKTLFVLAYGDQFENTLLSLRNIPNALVTEVEALNTYDVMNADTLVFSETAAKAAMEVFSK